MDSRQERLLDELLKWGVVGTRIADSAVRDIFPRPSRMKIDLLNLSGKDIDADGGFQKALSQKGLQGRYDALDASWQILPADMDLT